MELKSNPRSLRVVGTQSATNWRYSVVESFLSNAQATAHKGLIIQVMLKNKNMLFLGIGFIQPIKAQLKIGVPG
jgi:hypothetical protein